MAVEIEGEPLGPEVKPQNWMGKPLWEEKLRLWAILIEKGCLAKRGRGGAFCGWAGHACFYNGCPRRIFEEVAVAEKSQSVPSPVFIKEFETMRQTVAIQGKQIHKAKIAIQELEAQLKEES